MQVITESQNPQRDADIMQALEHAPATEVADMFGVSPNTIRRVARRVKGNKVYKLSITDGHQSVPVGQIITSRGFIHACKRAIREYSAFFARLELPQWRLVAGEETISLNAEELAG